MKEEIILLREIVHEVKKMWDNNRLKIEDIYLKNLLTDYVDLKERCSEPHWISVDDKLLEDKQIYNNIADWLERTCGYDFEKDADGFWFEEEVKEHKWKDIFILMWDYKINGSLSERSES